MFRSSVLGVLLVGWLAASVARPSVLGAPAPRRETSARKETAAAAARREAAAPALEASLEPHADRYSADLAGLVAERNAGLAKWRTKYLGELDAALAGIPAGADAARAAALTKERAGILDGLIVPANSASLPPEIQLGRKAFFSGVGSVGAGFEAAKKKADDAYLKVLATLARQNKNDKSLVAQIAAERRRIQAVP